MAKRDWNELRRQVEGLEEAAKEGTRCPECGCFPADPKRDKHEVLFTHEVEEDLESDYQSPEPGEEVICPKCGTVTDSWIIDDDGCIWFLMRRRGSEADPSQESREGGF